VNIEKFKLHERIKISYLKHRGNILAVVEELGVDAGYVRRVAEKIKGRERRDVDFLMANDLMQCILMGYESRVRHLMHMLSTLDQREQVRLSYVVTQLWKLNKNEERFVIFVLSVVRRQRQMSWIKLKYMS